MCSRSRAVAACSTSCTGSIFTARSSTFDDWSMNQISQPNSRRYQRVDTASRRAIGSGMAIARFFGNSSPNSICTTVQKISDTAVPTATPTPAGTLAMPRRSARPEPMSGSAT